MKRGKWNDISHNRNGDWGLGSDNSHFMTQFLLDKQWQPEILSLNISYRHNVRWQNVPVTSAIKITHHNKYIIIIKFTIKLIELELNLEKTC